MMLRNGRYTMYQLLIAFLICMALTGQSQPKNVSSLSHPSQASTTDLESSTEWKKTTLINGTGQMGNKTSKSMEWYFLSKEERKILNIVTMSVAALGALLNFVVIIAMAIDPLKVLRKGPWITILNLAIADLISCVSCFCVWGMKFFEVTDKLYLAIYFFGWAFGVSASFLILTFFTVQIFLITKFPLKSRYWFTTRKVVLAGIAVLLFAFLLGLSNIVYLRYFPLTVNLKIWVARIGVLQILVAVQVVLNIQVTMEIVRSGRRTGNAQNNKHRNIAKTVVILTLILFLTAFPYFILKQIEYFARMGYAGQSKTFDILKYLSYCYAPIALLNFAANPILYSLRLPDYRRTLLAFVGKSQSKNGSPNRTTTSKLTNAFSLRNQRTSETFAPRERSLVPHHADQPM